MGRFIDQRLIDDRTDGNKTDERGGGGEVDRRTITSKSANRHVGCHGFALLPWQRRHIPAGPEERRPNTHTHTYISQPNGLFYSMILIINI